MIVLYIENKQIINPLIRSYIPIVAIYNTIIHNLDISWYNINIIIYIYTIIYIHWIHHIHHQIHNWIHPIVYTLIYRELKKKKQLSWDDPFSPFAMARQVAARPLGIGSWRVKKVGFSSWDIMVFCHLHYSGDSMGYSWDFMGIYIIYIYIFVW